MRIDNELTNVAQRFHITKVNKRSHDETIKWHEHTDHLAQQMFHQQEKALNNIRRSTFLKANSIFNEKRVLEHRFSEIEYSPKMQLKVNKVREVMADYIKGKRYNFIMQGRAGTGKTLLASCLINYLNQATHIPCLFIDASMYSKLALSMNERDLIKEHSRFQQVNHAIKKAQVIVLDDFGSDTDMKVDVHDANNTIQKALFDFGNMTQDKAVVITTNNTGAELSTMYNPKIISRLLTMNSNHILNFDDLSDYRIAHN